MADKVVCPRCGNADPAKFHTQTLPSGVVGYVCDLCNKVFKPA